MLDFRPVTRLCWPIAIILAVGAGIHAADQGMKEFPNRREGTNLHLNALNDFTLLAIHRNFQLFPRDANLNVRFFLPQLRSNVAEKVFVEAVELQDSFHYFMQAKSSVPWKDRSWNTFGPWPTKDVIDSLGLEATNVGVLAGYQLGNDRPVYLPVDVYSDNEQPARHTYTFHLITGQDLQSLDLSLTDSAGKRVNLTLPQLKCNRGLNPNCRLYSAGSTLAFDLDMSSLPQAEYHLRLLGHVPRTSTPTAMEIVLYHHP